VGLAAEDAFLKLWVPRIRSSAAYRSNGVLIIAFAGSGTSGHPVRTGALVLSRYTRPGRSVARTYTPYGLLRAVEGMLHLTPALAHATSAPSFATAVLHKTG
jgi:hypothetical protein